jgi:hypothetical protein
MSSLQGILATILSEILIPSVIANPHAPSILSPLITLVNDTLKENENVEAPSHTTF